MEAVLGRQLTNSAARETVGKMLVHRSASVQRVAWQVIAQQTGTALNPDWVPVLQRELQTSAAGDLPLGQAGQRCDFVAYPKVGR